MIFNPSVSGGGKEPVYTLLAMENVSVSTSGSNYVVTVTLPEQIERLCGFSLCGFYNSYAVGIFYPGTLFGIESTEVGYGLGGTSILASTVTVSGNTVSFTNQNIGFAESTSWSHGACIYIPA